MTVPANLNRVDYTGTGSAGPFTVPFPFYDASHLTVLQTDALFNQTTLTGWTATGAGGPSGAVTLAAACPVGSTLTIMRLVPLTQITSIKNQEAFYPEVHEQEMDLLAMADQQLDEAMDRTLRLPAGLSGVDMTLPKPDPGHALVWNAAGDGLENAGVASATLQQDLADSADLAKGDEMIAVKQPFTGAVARTQHDKNAEWITPEDFGALGGSNDDTLFFQNAIDHLNASGGGVLRLTKPTYTCSTVTINSSNITIEGNGSILNKKSGSSSYLLIFTGTNKLSPVENILIKNLTLIGDPSVYASGGISVATTTATDQINNITIENVNCKSFGQYGIFIGSASKVKIKNVIIDEHGSTAGSSAIGIGFVIYPRDPQSDYLIDGLISKVNISSTLVASSAIKIQVASKILATNISAVNGTEEVMVIDATDMSIYQNLNIVNESITSYLGLVLISNDSSATPAITNAKFTVSKVRFKGAFSSCISMSNAHTYGLTLESVDTSQATGNKRLVIANTGICDSCVFRDLILDIRTDAYSATIQNCVFENCKTAGGWFSITGDGNLLKNCTILNSSGKFDIVGNNNLLQNCVNAIVGTGFECFKLTGNGNMLLNCVGKGSTLGKNLYIVSGTGNIISGCIFGDSANRIVDNGTSTVFNMTSGPVATGATTATLGTTSPATVATPYVWRTTHADDGTKCFIPLWK
jgi:hypothetical protein